MRVQGVSAVIVACCLAGMVRLIVDCGLLDPGTRCPPTPPISGMSERASVFYVHGYDDLGPIGWPPPLTIRSHGTTPMSKQQYVERGQAFVPAGLGRAPSSTAGPCISSSPSSCSISISSSSSGSSSGSLLFGRGERSASIIPPLAMAPKSAQQKKSGGGAGQQQQQQQKQAQAKAGGASGAAGAEAGAAAAGAAEGEEKVGVAKALARPSESRAAELREAKLQERSKTKKAFINPIEIPINAGRAARRALEKLGQVEEVSNQQPREFFLWLLMRLY